MNNLSLPAFVLTVLIFLTGIGSSYYAGYCAARKPEVYRPPREQWRYLCESPGLAELVIASVAIGWGGFIVAWPTLTDPVSVAMRGLCPTLYWGYLMVAAGTAQAWFVLWQHRAGRICCTLIELWIFLFASISLVWMHVWIAGIVVLPTYAIWTALLTVLVQRESRGGPTLQ